MNLKTKYFNYFKLYINDPLNKNSIFLILYSLTSAGFGFIFWILAAKLYPPEYVGISTALVSAMTLISTLSLLGLDQTTIRFIPEGNKSQIFSNSLIITFLSSLLLSIIFLLGVNIWSPQLIIAKEYPILFILFVLFTSLTSISGISLVALRKAKYYFVQGILMSSRVIFLFLFMIFGVLGIFYAIGVSYLFALIFSLVILFVVFKIQFKGINKEFLKKSFKYSTGTYIFGLFNSLPTLLLPILVLNILGPAATAYSYISFTIGSLIYIFPTSFGTSLFVEGSHGVSLKKNTLKSLISVFAITTPLIIILYFFGGILLGLIGKNYSTSGIELLKLIILSTYFVTICQLYYSIKKVQNDIKKLILVSGFNFIALIILSYILMIKIGIMGIGYAWLIGYGLSNLLIAFIIKKEKWFNDK